MPSNADIAAQFERAAAVLEILGGDRFRVAAYQRVARALEGLAEDVASFADDEARLVAIEGIGKASAHKIAEYCRTGSIAEFDEHAAEIPEGLLGLLELQGLGPKTVRLLWQEAGVVDRPSLAQAIDEGRLEGLPRMGPKTIANMKEALARFAEGEKRLRLGRALGLAETIVEMLRGMPGVRRVEWAGSLRRGRETIGDLDVLAAADDAEGLAAAFRALPEVEHVLAAGASKSSVVLRGGVQVDLRIVPEPVFGAAWLYFTGSKEHNVLLRERAIRKGMRLNEYGLFEGRDDATPIAAGTEQEIYAALGLPWIPPELREARGELDRPVPALIELADVRRDLHAHTVASDGHLSIRALAEEAKRRGYDCVAVTDHSKSSVQANGLDEARLAEHVAAIRAVDAEIDGIRVLAGAEVDILADGRLDYDDDVLATLDIVIASPHAALTQDPTVATARLLRAIAHPRVHVIGHPTGRIIGRRRGLEPAFAEIVAAAVEHDTALEINANEMRLDLRDVHVAAAVEAGALLAIDTDAHAADQFDQMRLGVATARRGGLTAAQCINAWPLKKLLDWLG